MSVNDLHRGLSSSVFRVEQITQNPVVAIPCRFDPDYRHQKEKSLWRLFFFQLFFQSVNVVAAAIAVGQIGMPHKADMPHEVGICLYVGHAEDLAQLPDAVKSKHLRIHASVDPIGHMIRVCLKFVKCDAAVPQTVLILGKIPFARDRPCKRETVDDFFRRMNACFRLRKASFTKPMIASFCSPASFSSRHMVITA